ADSLAKDLAYLAPPGSPLLEPPEIPLVLPVRGPNGTYLSDAPFHYHLARLDALLAVAASTQEAVDLTVKRLIHGFSAQAAVVVLANGARLRVAGAAGCTRDFLRSLDSMPLGQPAVETEAMARLRPSIHPPDDPRTRDRCTPHDGRPYTWLVLPLAAGGQ